MGMTIAIDKSYMNKMPKSCKECPLTYLDTGDDAYFGANERRCVIDDSCIDGMASERAYDCPLVEAISKDQYEARLKDDMVAMLEDLDLEIDEHANIYADGISMKSDYVSCEDMHNLIRIMINNLRRDNESSM